MSSLRVSRHPRGHIADCNGRLDLVKARVEPCGELKQDAVKMAVLAEAQCREEKKREQERLKRFQVEVSERVRRKNKRRQLRVATNSGEAVHREQSVAEKAMALDSRGRQPHSLPVPRRMIPDVDDVCVIGCLVTSGQTSLSQQARSSLLALRDVSQKPPPPCDTTNHPPPQTDSHSTYVELDQHNPSATAEVKRSSHDITEGGDEVERSLSSSQHRFTPVGQIEHAQRKQAGVQYLLFRRLYSDLEREQVRQKQLQRAHHERVQRLKKGKEADRRLAEDEVNTMESFSTVTSETIGERQRAEEWAEMVALEERRHQLQRAKEMERYIDALKGRLRERLAQRQTTVPPLCSCGSSVWDTDPNTCANNCIFYRNQRAYAKALSNLLASLKV